MNTNRLSDDIVEYAVQIRGYDGRVVDISDLVVAVQLYQSVFTPAITAKLVVSDRIDFLNSFPLNGEEAVRIIFRSHSSAQKSELDIFLFTCEDIEIDPSLMNLSYTLYGTSVEALTDTYAPIQKGYQRQISGMVQDIYQTFLRTSKRITVEQTSGNPTLIIPKLTPFQALNFLKKRAVSSYVTSSVFMSFETLDGFSFRSLEGLIKDGLPRAEQPEYQYVLEHASIIDQTRQLLDKNIIAFKQQRKYDTLEQMQSGYFYSKTLKYDFVEKREDVVEFKLAEKYPDWNTLEGTGNLRTALHTERFINDFDANSMRRFANVYDMHRTELPTSDNIGMKSSYLINMLQNQYEMIIPGNNALVPGDVIMVNVPNLAAYGEQRLEDRMHGKYFVADVTHSIINKSKFYSKLLCFRDSNSE